jgi:hypothetical protein
VTAGEDGPDDTGAGPDDVSPGAPRAPGDVAPRFGRSPDDASGAGTMTPEEYLRGDRLGLAVLERVASILGGADADAEMRATKSQIAFRRRRGFAYVWLPGRYLGRRSEGIVVLSIALGRPDGSTRWKEVTQVSPNHWMHHLEARDEGEIDDEVAAWLLEAWARAG